MASSASRPLRTAETSSTSSLSAKTGMWLLTAHDPAPITPTRTFLLVATVALPLRR